MKAGEVKSFKQTSWCPFSWLKCLFASCGLVVLKRWIVTTKGYEAGSWYHAITQNYMTLTSLFPTQSSSLITSTKPLSLTLVLMPLLMLVVTPFRYAFGTIIRTFSTLILLCTRQCRFILLCSGSSCLTLLRFSPIHISRNRHARKQILIAKPFYHSFVGIIVLVVFVPVPVIHSMTC